MIWVYNENSWVILAHLVWSHDWKKRKFNSGFTGEVFQLQTVPTRTNLHVERTSGCHCWWVTCGVPITKKMVSRVVLSTNSGGTNQTIAPTLMKEKRRNLQGLRTSCTPLWLEAKYSTKRSNLKFWFPKCRLFGVTKCPEQIHGCIQCIRCI